MSPAIYWFRNDLRLTDNPALAEACAQSRQLILLYARSADETAITAWGCPRWGPHRRAFRDQALRGLRAEVAAIGGTLLVAAANAVQVIPDIAARTGADRVFCEAIAAPEEIAEVAALRAAGLEVRDRWQSSLLDPADLPFGIDRLPEVFTAFRQAVEQAGVLPRAAIAAPRQLPPMPTTSDPLPDSAEPLAPSEADWFAFGSSAFDGAESCGLAHVESYFASAAPQSYKATRNGLVGTAYSTKLSPWLAVGALSPRTIVESLRAHEARQGANDGTYWIWFELLWRDFFRFWSIRHGARLFRARGLGTRPPPGHEAAAFARWCAGQTGHAFVDAGMRELAATGYMSNRMRQVVASYLIHDLRCDWRAGAAWFESRLIDYDVCSNQGNWLYIAGRGADPRQGRRFDPDKQAREHDPDGVYRAMWASDGGSDAR
jgi:deoxyribodipyrimidine photo-lyase